MHLTGINGCISPEYPVWSGNYSRKAQEKPKKSPRNIEVEILEIMQYNPNITRKELAKLFNRTEDSIRYYIRKMTDAGIIKHEGATKSGKWVIINKD